MIFHQDPKTFITILFAFLLTALIVGLSKFDNYTFVLVFGAFIPILDGMLWGKDRWDQHPMLYVIAGIIFVLIQIIIDREHRIMYAVIGGVGMVCMQAILYYAGKLDKNR